MALVDAEAQEACVAALEGKSLSEDAGRAAEDAPVSARPPFVAPLPGEPSERLRFAARLFARARARIACERPSQVLMSVIADSGWLGPVSYTHLDVYKRQMLDLVVDHEYTMTPLAMLSDYVLPAAGWLERPQLWGVGGGGPCITGVALTGEAAVPPLYERRDNYEFWRSMAEGTFDQETVDKYWSWQTTEEAYDAMLEPQGTSARDAITNPVFNSSPEEWHKMNDPKTGQLYLSLIHI